VLLQKQKDFYLPALFFSDVNCQGADADFFLYAGCSCVLVLWPFISFIEAQQMEVVFEIVYGKDETSTRLESLYSHSSEGLY